MKVGRRLDSGVGWLKKNERKTERRSVGTKLLKESEEQG